MSERKLTDKIRWLDAPPDLEIIRVPILSPKPTQQLTLGVVCNEEAVVPTHYIRERTTACVGAENGCEGCLVQARTLVKLYLGVWWPEQDRCWAAEVAHGAIGYVWSYIIAHRGKLRGSTLLLGRPSKHKNGRVTALLRPMDQFERREWRLPREFDLKASLSQVWVNLRERPPIPPEALPGEWA